MGTADGRGETTGEDHRTATGPARSFEDLIAWQKAHGFVLAVYSITKRLPRHEMFGLTAQLRRAAISIPANIAEGFKKRGQADKLRFLNIAQGSAEECRYYLILVRDLQYADPSEALSQLEDVRRLLSRYAAAIRQDMS